MPDRCLKEGKVHDMSGVATAWDFIKQVLGMAGLAESIFELVYIFTQIDNLRQFESFFFAFLATSELLGEKLAILVVLRSCQNIQFESEAKRWMPQVARVAQLLVRDPMHNLADSSTTVFSGDALKTYYRGHAFCVVISAVYPVVAWIIFVPLWPFFYEDDDRSLKLRICCSMWGLIALVTWSKEFWLLSLRSSVLPSSERMIRVGREMLAEYVVLVQQSCVALSLLFSRGDRLANGRVGEALRALQLAELSSAGRILWQLFSDDNYAEKCVYLFELSRTRISENEEEKVEESQSL